MLNNLGSIVKKLIKALRENGIARRMSLYIILFSAVSTMVLSIIQLNKDYDNYIEEIEKNVQIIGNTQLELLSNSIWSLNDQQVQTQLDSMLQVQDIEYVAVLNDDTISWSSGEPLSKKFKEHLFPIEHEHRRQMQIIGTLKIRSSIDSVYNRIEERLTTIISNNAKRTFIIALFVFIFFQFMVTRHLNKIASYAQAIDITDNSKQMLNLERGKNIKGTPDELEKVVNSINLMQNNMIHTHLQLKESEKKMSIMLHNAEAANRSKSDFLAAMSHDLRTPLNAILGFSEMMKNEMLGPLGSERYASYAGDINQSGKYLLALINDILDISKIEAGERIIQKEAVDFKGVATNCYDMVKLDAEAKNVACKLKLAKNLKPIQADHQALMQIMMNLTSNAVKFTPKGGSITVSASTSKNGNIIKVVDTGVGIAANNLATITDPFTRAETDPYKTNEGTGLGLAIVKSLVDLHGGSMDIKSTVNVGTTVTIKLPLS